MGWDNISGENVKKGFRSGRGGKRRTGKYGFSANSSSHSELSWRFKEFTEGVVTKGVGSLFQYFSTHVEKAYDVIPNKTFIEVFL